MKFNVVALLTSALFPGLAFAVSSTDQYQDADTAQSGYLPNHNVDPTKLGQFVHSWSTAFNTNEKFSAKPITFTPNGYSHELVIVVSHSNIVRVVDGLSGAVLFTRTLDPPFLATDSNCGDISPTIGITGTPIVDPATDIMYFFSKGYKGGATGGGTLMGQYKFYAVQLPGLTDISGFPIIMEGRYANNDHARYFVGGTLLQRPGLAMIGNSIVAGFGGHCDNFNYTGMLISVSKTTATVTNIQAMVAAPGAPSPQPTDYIKQTGGKAGIWHAGMGLAVRGNNVFFATGNGVGPGINKVQGQAASGKVYSSTLEQVVANFYVDPVTGNLSQADYFEPYNFDTQLNGGDLDMGSAGVALLDRNTFQAPGVGVNGIAVSSGKNGIVYIMNADNLGGFFNGPNGIQDATLQQIPLASGERFYGGVGSYPGDGGYLYFCPTGGPMYAYSFSLDRSGNPLFTLAGQTSGTSLACTGNPTITSLNGQPGTGVVWLADTNQGVVAYKAVPTNGVLTPIPLGWASGRLNRYQRPVFGNARVYTTENNMLYAIAGPAGTAASSSSKPTSTSSSSKPIISSTVSSSVSSSTLTTSSSSSSSSVISTSSSVITSSSSSSVLSSSSTSSTLSSSSTSSKLSSSSSSSAPSSTSSSSSSSASSSTSSSVVSTQSSSTTTFVSSTTTGGGQVFPTTGLNPAEPSAISTFKYIGCFSDLADGTTRTLSANKFVYDPMTLESCAQNCTNYDFFGTEYGRECYCGYTLNATYRAIESSCNTKCSGNAGELCGSASRLSVYQNNNYIAPPPGPAHKQVVGNYGWIGCYTEATNIRALSSKSFTNASMTVEQCVGFCNGYGYSYAGVEYATQCYCGNVLNTGSVLTATTDCKMLCGGSSLEYCGAGSRLDVYQQGAVPTTSSSIVVSSTVVSSSTISSSVVTSSSVSTLSSTLSSSSSPVITSSSSAPSSASSTIKSSSTSTTSTVRGTATNPAPIRRTYNWNIGWVNAAPDGFNRPFVAINGQWPLPAITANIGDVIVINAVNSLGNETTSIHFHGMAQTNTTFEDGAAMVGQCPIPPGGTFVYQFTITQSGTYWYHAHVGGQYVDGFRGPLIIKDANQWNNYGSIDQEVVLTLSDVYHVEAPYLINYFLSADNFNGAEPVPDSALINEAQNVKFTMIPGKTYMFHVINMGAVAGQYLQFDQHKMTIIEADGVYTQPYDVDQLFVAVAQRYSVLVKAMPTATQNFAIVSQFLTSMFDETAVPDGQNPTCTAWLVYNPALPLPSPFTLKPQPWDDTALVPYDQQPLWDSANVQSVYLTVDFNQNDWGSNRAMVNGQTYIPQNVPTFFTALTAPSQYISNPSIYGQVNPVILPFGQVIEINLNNHDTRAHPFHLHGHQFQIVQRAGNEPQWPGLYSTPAIPMRRDTVVVYAGVSITLRFVANNPGIWLFHCHTEFHVEAGMTATFIEAPDEMVARKPYVPGSHRDTCDSQGIPRKGNAGGNSKNWLDLSAANTESNASYYGALINGPAVNPYSGGQAKLR